ncbi:MAG: ABC transporter ATP-binding protein [Vicinamibacterales bacterium]
MSTGVSSAPLLSVSNLSVSFRTEAGLVRAVRSISYDVRPGEVLGLVGESGSGKSVSSLAVMNLLPDHAQVSGSARLDGHELIGRSDDELSSIRGSRIAMVFQDPLSALTPVYTVGEQIAEAILVHERIDHTTAMRKAVDLLDLVGIPNARQRAAAFPHEFSGGMRQRVMIAMAIANDPALIIADEPTTALDVTIQAQILDVLQTARTVTGAAIVLITHDLGVIAGVADRVAVMYAGTIVETGTVDDVFYRPRMPYTMGLLGSIPRADQGERQPLTPIDGAPPSLIDLPSGCPFHPRCPMTQEVCTIDEPALLPIARLEVADQQRAACHFRDDIERRQLSARDSVPRAGAGRRYRLQAAAGAA